MAAELCLVKDFVDRWARGDSVRRVFRRVALSNQRDRPSKVLLAPDLYLIFSIIKALARMLA